MVMRFRFNHGVPPVNVEEWRQIARRKLPGMSLSYLEGGADDLLTVEENMAAYKRWRLRTLQLTGISNPDLTTTIAGSANPENIRRWVDWIRQPIDSDLLREVQSLFAGVKNIGHREGLPENN